MNSLALSLLVLTKNVEKEPRWRPFEILGHILVAWTYFLINKLTAWLTKWID